MNKLQCEYCQSLNEGNALECRKCGAPLSINDATARLAGRLIPPEGGGSGNGYVTASDGSYDPTKSLYNNIISRRL